jgi:hypothetical protein
VRYRLLFNAEQRIVDHKDQENSEMEVLWYDVWRHCDFINISREC